MHNTFIIKRYLKIKMLGSTSISVFITLVIATNNYRPQSSRFKKRDGAATGRVH